MFGFGFLIFNFEKRFLATRRVATRCAVTCRGQLVADNLSRGAWGIWVGGMSETRREKAAD
ncbi:MAG: hypothetical protein CRN43_03885 [Candidatus Nephrothrix sp. EaCA]|nr:MAG: hypothetical protein CRN43_03885 [Candidatus Nephrothrix sp. EaCA]